MSEWKDIVIGDIGKVITGNTPPTTNRALYGGPYPFIKPTDMEKDSRYVRSWEETYSEQAFQRYKSAYIPKGATGVVTIGTVGEKLFQADRPCFTNQSVNVVVPNDDFDYDFVYYLLKYNLIKVQNANPGTASGRDHVSKSNFSSIQVKIPTDKKIQNQIGHILSAYDELIENNNRRIAILEQTAEQIYKEWFVRMRFPGYENTEFEKGVPKGWEWKKVGEIFKTSSGGTPSRQKEQEYFGGNIDWIKTGELKDSYIFDSEEKITDAGLQNSSAKLFPPDSLLMAMYGVNIGQLGISVKPSTANQAVCVFSPKAPKEYSLYYSYFYFKSIRSHLFNISMGAAQQNLSQEIIKRLNFLKPEKNLLSSFNKIQKPIFELLLKLSLQNQNLKQTRDLLLPRLISGKLKVKEAEKEID